MKSWNDFIWGMNMVLICLLKYSDQVLKILADKYLDVIMRDYEEFISLNKELVSEVKELTSDNLKLKQEIRSLKMKLDVLKDNADGDSGNSVDVLKRLSNLEKVIYGKE
jgi:cell division septum initiation protein DivIVA